MKDLHKIRQTLETTLPGCRVYGRALTKDAVVAVYTKGEAGDHEKIVGAFAEIVIHQHSQNCFTFPTSFGFAFHEEPEEATPIQLEERFNLTGEGRLFKGTPCEPCEGTGWKNPRSRRSKACPNCRGTGIQKKNIKK